MFVSSNGYITFGTGASQYSNYPLPSTSMPASMISAFMDDLYPVTAGDVYFQDFGDSAYVQFNNVSLYSSTTDLLTFQMVLYRSGTIMFRYRSMTGTLTSSTTGIQNGTRDVGLGIAYNTSYVHNNLAVRISPVPHWLRLAQLQGTVDPGEIDTITATFDATNVQPGLVTENLRITHNAPGGANPLTVPCSLAVDGMRRLSVSPLSYTYPPLWTGASAEAVFTLSNAGNEPTTIYSAVSSNQTFMSGTTLPIVVPAGGSTTLRIVFSPLVAGQHSGTVTITSNAEDNSTINVALSGTGIAAPEIAVSPSGFSVNTTAATPVTRPLSIANTGGADLTFQIRIQRPSSMRINLNQLQDSIPILSQRATCSSDDAVVPLPQLHFDNGQLAEEILVLATTSLSNSVVAVLNALGKPHTLLQTFDFTTIDFAPFDIIIVGMDGGSISEASLLALANAASSGKKLIMIGGTSYTPYYTGMQNYLLRHTNQQGWVTSTTPHHRITDSAHPLASGLPQTYSYVNSSASYYMIRINDDLAHVVATNGDGFPTLVEKPIGNGSLYYFTSSASDSYWGNAPDRAMLQTIIENAINLSANNWVRVQPNAGTISGGNRFNAEVVFDATGLPAGRYYAQLAVFHNAPLPTTPVVIPCTLTVRDAEPPPQYIGRILTIGPSRQLEARGSAYRLEDIHVGSPVVGRLNGAAYRLILK
jgi:hypothetical protein